MEVMGFFSASACAVVWFSLVCSIVRVCALVSLWCGFFLACSIVRFALLCLCGVVFACVFSGVVCACVSSGLFVVDVCVLSWSACASHGV